jgi:hypothetical protein
MSESNKKENTRGGKAGSGNPGKGGPKGGNSTKETTCSPSTAIGNMIAIMSELKVEDRIMAAKAIAGLAGMVAMFPNQIPQRGKSDKANGPKDKDKEKKKKDTPKQVPNPLKESSVYKTFRAAQIAMSEAKKANGGENLPADDPVSIAYKEALEAWKDFRDQNKPK